MLISVYVPFAVSAVLAVLAPRLAPVLPPRVAAGALLCTAVVTAAGWVGALGLLAFTAFAQIPEVAREGRWSVPALRAQDPVRLAVAVACALALAVACGTLAVSATRRARALLRARRESRRLPDGGELVVLDDDAPCAFAVPGPPRRIVVSRGMLCALADGGEREALLAHERAHLRGRHHLFQTAWLLTSAVNPLLLPLARTGGYVLERWADEEAAATVGDRTVVARAVARAALASSPSSPSSPSGRSGNAGGGRPGAALAATGGAVPRRVRALLVPPPRPRPRHLTACATGGLLLALCCGSLAEAVSDNERIMDSAQLAACAAVDGWQPPLAVDRARGGQPGGSRHSHRDRRGSPPPASVFDDPEYCCANRD